MSGNGGRMNTELAGGWRTVTDLVEVAGQLPPTKAAVAGGSRIEDLRLVESARDHGILDRIVLVGDARRIARSVEEAGIEIPPEDIVAVEDDEAACAATVALARSGVVNMVLKGSVSTSSINRHMLPLADRPTVSLVSLFDAAPIADGRPMILTDAGITTVCHFGRMADLIGNAVEVARVVMGIEHPRVAVLSASEKPVESMASTWMGRRLAERDWPGVHVYGPISLDLATDPRSVSMKGFDVPEAREVAGRADILLCPNIDTGNVIYKCISAMIKYGLASLANMIVGFPISYVLLSRSDALETRLNSVALGSIYAQRALNRPRPACTVAVPDPVAYRILAVNPGSTSLKLAIYEDDQNVRETELACEIRHSGVWESDEAEAARLADLAQRELETSGVGGVDAIAARGGFLPRPPGKLPGGVYVVAERTADGIAVDEAMVGQVLRHPERRHAANFGIPVAAILSRRFGVPAYAVDPVVVDEFDPVAEISGYAPITRRSTSHALSIRAAAARAAREIGRPLADLNLVVAHLGGGITVAAVKRGRMTDNNIALLGGGPFTPQRAGALPTGALIDLCYSGRFARDELIEELTRRGGLQSYLGEYRMETIERRIADGDEHARLVVDAMAYQIAKEIGAMYVATGCDIEAIVLTGGLVHGATIRNAVRKRIGMLAPVIVYPGSLEMAALAAGAIAVLSGRENAQVYRPLS